MDSERDIKEALAREQYMRDNNLRVDALGREKKIEAPKLIAPTPMTGHMAMVAVCNECGEEMRRLSDTMNEDGSVRVNLICPKCWYNAPKKIDQVEPRAD